MNCQPVFNGGNRVYSLLVWLILTFWVTNLLHKVILLVEDVVSDTGEVSVLQIGIEVDLDNTISNGIRELLLR